MSTRKEIEKAITKEVAEWSGVEVEFVDGTKHPKAKLKFGGRILRTTYPGTPSDRRSIHNTISDCRRVMKKLGAQRGREADEADELAAIEKAEARAREKKAAKARPKNEGRAKRPDPEPVDDQPADQRTPMADFLDDVDREPRRVELETKEDRAGWGLYTDLAPMDYFADPAPRPSLSRSMAKVLIERTSAEAAFAHPRLNPDQERVSESLALRRGDVVHQLVLGKGRGYAVSPYAAFRSNEAKAWKKDAEAEGLTVVKEDEFANAQQIAERVLEQVKRVLEGASYETEVVGLYEEDTPFGPVWCRIMMDIWCAERATILDPKISGQLYDNTIERHAGNMGWDLQHAMYKHAVGKIIPELAGRVQFADLLCHPDPPHVSRLWAPDAAWEMNSMEDYKIAVWRFGRCQAQNDWPGYGPRVERGEEPVYLNRQRESRRLAFIRESTSV